MKETKEFQTESKEILSLMINSIYSNNEIFLRELISNASDAIDKYKFNALKSDGKLPIIDHEIRLSVDKNTRTLTISDNGIGMTKNDLINNLGTIAKSGSKAFVKKLKEATDKNDFNIIGQFGVGFYSAFMVADKVEVLTKTANGKAFLFTSDGKDSYTIEDAKKEETGTNITIYLKKTTNEINYDKYLEEYTLKGIVKKYSDYIRYPIKMLCSHQKKKIDENGKELDNEYETIIEDETLNSMIPLWRKNKSEVKDEELNNFYKEKFNDFEDPLVSLFVRVDGNITYDALLYIPSHVPYDLYSDAYEKGLELYSKGVFIKEKCPELVPDYLKFVKGLVDSPDFNLNISREILQQSPMMKKISENIEKKIVSRLGELMKEDFDKYTKFFEAFGEHLKFGIYSTYGAKKDLLENLLVYHSLVNEDKYISLKEYKEKMLSEQKYIYYASGDSLDSIKLLPQIEKYRKMGIDVLLLDKKIDEFAIMMLRDYDKIEFKSITDESANEITEEEKKKIETVTNENMRLLDTIKEALKSEVDDVVISSKLVDAPVCLSTKDGLSLEMEKTLNEQPGMNNEVKAQKVLEINPEHDLFKILSTIQADDDTIKEYASILFDEAMILEGREIKNRGEFISKLNSLMIKAFKK
ncbi:MAG: molecular chaperone HtpG [Erysipelotrichales bacterium]|nr:molecular chaperone HtpG [Erysipelotrichales bacterium]